MLALNSINSSVLPFVVLPCDVKHFGSQPFNALGRKYTDALRIGANVLPVPIPVGRPSDLHAYLSMASGVLFTGSVANIHPSHFNQDVYDPSLPLDQDRDAISLPLIREVIKRGMPFLAICRGHQELNVALGGSLHQAVHELEGKRDHREPTNVPVEQMYQHAHPIQLVDSGVMHGLFKTTHLNVNSLHGQAIDRLADGLLVDAVSPDGVIEAVRLKDHPSFGLGCQFHPEWDIENNETGQLIFKAFGQACYAYAEQQNAIRKTVPTG